VTDAHYPGVSDKRSGIAAISLKSAKAYIQGQRKAKTMSIPLLILILLTMLRIAGEVVRRAAN